MFVVCCLLFVVYLFTCLLVYLFISCLVVCLFNCLFVYCLGVQTSAALGHRIPVTLSATSECSVVTSVSRCATHTDAPRVLTQVSLAPNY